MALLIAGIHAALLLILGGNLLYLRRGRRKSGASGDPPSVSVLIPARNEEANLTRLLPTLLSQQYERFEVIVYDDGSEDGTWEVIRKHASPRLKPLRGSGPPSGWVGKVHALFQSTRHATGDVFLFLDADAELLHPDALGDIVAAYRALPEDAVLTGLTGLSQSGGRLLVSLVPNAILTGLPWFLARRLDWRSLGALNGQCWAISREHYARFEPHKAHPNEVLEDVVIGRFLRTKGLQPTLVDVQQHVAIHMYTDLEGAWHGFRKNAYLILGGTPTAFAVLFPFYVFTFVLAPLFSPWLFLTQFALKLGTDRLCRFPLWITVLAPLSYALAAVLQVDSALAHFRKRVQWKGRPVSV